MCQSGSWSVEWLLIWAPLLALSATQWGIDALRTTRAMETFSREACLWDEVCSTQTQTNSKTTRGTATS